MSYGIEIYNASGDKLIDSDSFGIMFRDDFLVDPTVSGSQAYNDLTWHHNIWVVQSQEIQSSYSHTYRDKNYSNVDKAMTFVTPFAQSFNTLNMSVTTDGSNVPTLSWSQGHNVGETTYNVRVRVLVT